jgi:hypothetical protein
VLQNKRIHTKQGPLGIPYGAGDSVCKWMSRQNRVVFDVGLGSSLVALTSEDRKNNFTVGPLGSHLRISVPSIPLYERAVSRPLSAWHTNVILF